jgi:hypothetical protein
MQRVGSTGCWSPWWAWADPIVLALELLLHVVPTIIYWV